MRLVFAGTPATAVPTLEALLTSRHAVAAVITRPDAKSGRGLQMVDALSDVWGWSPIAGGGKAVWAILFSA